MRWLRSFVQLFRRTPSSPKLIATVCGHETALSGRVTAFGEYTETTMPYNESGSTDFCLDCIGKMAIRCAWCGGPIFIGDAVTLYTPRSSAAFERRWGQYEFSFVEAPGVEFQIPDHAIIVNTNPLQLVGCLRMSCADTGADRAGFWVPGPCGVGGVQRVQTLFEQAIASDADVLVVNNVLDPQQAAARSADSYDVPSGRWTDR